MSGLNKVMLIGNLGKDPEVRYLPNGDPVASVSIATSRTWKDKQTGEKKEQTEWHNVTLFKRLAEIISEYCAKGSKVYIEGFLKTDKWEDKNGNTRYTTKIVARELQMLSFKNDGQPRGNPNPRQESMPVGQEAPDDGFDDDIPF